MVYFEREILKYLDIPSVPKKVWDGKSSFKDGVAKIAFRPFGEGYAVVTFNKDKDKAPRIKHVFSNEPFKKILEIYPVPQYMDDNIQDFDMDERSKQAAASLIEEAKEYEMEGIEQPKTELPTDNEYFFSHIKNDEQAIAYIKAYNKRNKIRGALPKTHENIIIKLSVMWADQQKRNKGV